MEIAAPKSTFYGAPKPNLSSTIPKRRKKKERVIPQPHIVSKESIPDCFKYSHKYAGTPYSRQACSMVLTLAWGEPVRHPLEGFKLIHSPYNIPKNEGPSPPRPNQSLTFPFAEVAFPVKTLVRPITFAVGSLHTNANTG